MGSSDWNDEDDWYAWIHSYKGDGSAVTNQLASGISPAAVTNQLPDHLLPGSPAAGLPPVTMQLNLWSKSMDGWWGAADLWTTWQSLVMTLCCYLEV